MVQSAREEKKKGGAGRKTQVKGKETFRERYFFFQEKPPGRKQWRARKITGGEIAGGDLSLSHCWEKGYA